MKKLKVLSMACLAMITVLFSCNEKDHHDFDGEVQFGFSPVDLPSGRVTQADASKLLVTVEDSDGEVVLDRMELDLVAFGDSYLTDPVSLRPGSYEIPEYLVMNSSSEVVYACPKEGSDFAHLVENPLPVSFDIESDVVNQVGVEVVPANAGTGEEFGYATFTFNVVDYVQFDLAVFMYDLTSSNYVLTSADYSISADGEDIISGALDSATNTLTLPIRSSYTLIIEKSGYNTYSETFTKGDLDSHQSDPLEVELLGEELAALVIETDSTSGKDAILFSLDPDTNKGEVSANYALAWTWSDLGGAGVQKSIMEFDMADLPAGKEVMKATLKLKFMSNSYFADLYHQFKSNEALLQRVTEAWDETTVTWNNAPAVTTTNQVEIPSTIDNHGQDYTIDVTQLVKDQQVDGNFGFMLSLVSTDYYRGVVMASSDHADSSLRPSLEIIYTK